MNRTELDRRQVIIGSGATLGMSGINRGAAAGDDIDSLLKPLLRDGKVSGLHTLLAARGGRLIVERYWEGEDWDRGDPLGKVTFGPKVLHDLRSVSKSIVGMLYGIALADPERLGRLFASAGFQGIHVERETREGTIDSIADYWEPIETGVGSLPQAYVALSDTDRRAVRAEVTARLTQFESNGRLVISVETLIARGRA